MTFLATQPKEERQQQQAVAMTPGDPDGFDPGAFEGTFSGAGTGVGRFVSVANQLAGEAEYQIGALVTRPVDDLFDTDWTSSLDRRLRQAPAQLTASMTPDPYTTGTVGQVLYGVTGVLAPAAVGTYFGGPAGGMAMAGSFSTQGTFTDLTQQGVDPNTAAGAAVFEGSLMAAGVGLPAAISGKVALNTLLYGPGVNVAQSVIAGQGTGAWLESQGYGELADRYATYDAEMIAADIVLGAAFGYMGARAGRAPRGTVAQPSTGDVDAALVAINQRHAELDTAPGIPADLAAVKAHSANLQAATEALLDGRPVETKAQGGTFVAKPDNPAYGNDALVAAFRESGYPELLADVKALEAELEARGRQSQDAPLPDMPGFVERRGDRSELGRLNELRSARQGRRLTFEESDELLTLETRDRMAAKVAGRRIPGVQNMEARVEAEAAGSLLPVQGFADADNFKRVNDELGHDVGDQVIAQMGRLFAEALGDGNVFHRGGDEFLLQAKTPEQFKTAMESVRATLEKTELVATRADGTTVSRRGVRFSYGEGKTAKEAEEAQYADKEARKRAGLRTDRPDEAGGEGGQAAQPPANAGRAGAGVGDEGGANRAGGDAPAARGERSGEEGPAAGLVEAQARDILDENPDMTLPARAVDEAAPDGDAKAADALESAEAAMARAQKDASGFDAAVACFLRRGA